MTRSQELINAKIRTSELCMRFIAMISHDMKSSLNAVTGGIALTRMSLSDPASYSHKELLEVVDLMETACHDLETLIKNFVSMGKSTATKFTIDPLFISNLPDMLNHLLDTFRNEARGKGVELKLNIRTDLPEVFWDWHKIRCHLINNILSNCIRYTPRNGQVSLTVEHAGHDIIFTISDTGPGIKKEIRQSIQELFEGPDFMDFPPSSGLGLYNAKYIAREHGGNIHVMKQDDREGATFQIVLPIKARDYVLSGNDNNTNPLIQNLNNLPANYMVEN